MFGLDDLSLGQVHIYGYELYVDGTQVLSYLNPETPQSSGQNN